MLSLKKALLFLTLSSSFLVSSKSYAGIFDKIIEAQRKAAEAAAAAEANSCATIYTGANGDGTAALIGKNNYMDNLSSHLYARRSWHGGLNPRWSGTDRAWTDLHSAKVKSGCTLSVYRTPDASDPPSTLAATDLDTHFFGGSYSLPGQTQALKCRCGLVLPTIGFEAFMTRIPN